MEWVTGAGSAVGLVGTAVCAAVWGLLAGVAWTVSFVSEGAVVLGGKCAFGHDECLYKC